MAIHLSWASRDEEGKRFQIEFVCAGSGRKMTPQWLAKYKRHENRETYRPTAEDWNDLEETAQRNLQRGLLRASDLAFIQRLRKEQSPKEG